MKSSTSLEKRGVEFYEEWRPPDIRAMLRNTVALRFSVKAVRPRRNVIFPIAMNFGDVRRLAIIAMFSDDSLMDRLVLKGGNAMALVYSIGGRTSLDVDLSIDGDFEDLDDARKRSFQGLRSSFDTAGYVVFDEVFEPKPAARGSGQYKDWGGYVIDFKLIQRDRYEELRGDLEALRRNAIVTGPLQRKTFRIELSKYEFCEGKTEAELDDYAIYVYTTEMIAIEKIRALCQQLPEYTARLHKTARARDFYDIHALVAEARVDLSSSKNLELARNIFAAKHVPLELIPRIAEAREQHRPDWPSVEASVTGTLRSFDYYFDFVVHQIQLMKSLWIE